MARDEIRELTCRPLLLRSGSSMGARHCVELRACDTLPTLLRRWLLVCGSFLLGAAVVIAPVADAAEKRSFPMALREVDTDLRAHGLGLTLPADAVGGVDWVFDTRFLVVRTGALELWVGRPDRPGKSPCTLDQLVAKAQDERGYVARVRKGSDAPKPLVAYSLRDAGVESFQVAACVPTSSALCGAPDLQNRKAVDAAFALCGTLRDVTPQAPLETRLGIYSVVFVDGEAGDRAAGRGGSGKRAVYAVALVDEPSSATATLSSVQLTYDTFRAAPIAIKSAWPLYLPADLDGRFAEPGVLIVSGKRYEKESGKSPARR